MRRVVLLVVVFGALLLLWGYQRYERGKIVVSEPAETVELDPEQATRVRIHRPDDDVELVRSGSGWKLTAPVEYPANTKIVEDMLNSLSTLQFEDVISSNPDNRATYQVDSTGTAVDVWVGEQQVLGLVVGKNTPTWSHTYVRRAEQDEVYRAVGVITYNFNRKPDDWRDKSILNLKDGDIDRIVLEYPKEKLQLSLARADTIWTLSSGRGDPEPADSLTASRLVRNAATLTSLGFPAEEETAGHDFAKPDFKIVVFESGGHEHTVSFVAIDENKMLAKREGWDTIFSLNKSAISNLMKKPEDLRLKA